MSDTGGPGRTTNTSGFLEFGQSGFWDRWNKEKFALSQVELASR